LKLYIAEKPGLGRAIADVLPRPHRKEEGCIRVGNGDYVSWCIGHLLEQAEPKAYDPAYQQWREEHLPIIPQDWKLQPKPKTRKQLTILRKLIKQSDEIIHAGDPDREGQLLVDQVIDYLGVKGRKRDAVQRCLINDLNPAAVRRALAQLRSNKDFVPLSTSALARSRADWLYGINMTRAYTLQGRKVGFDGLLSVGRVQTPVLGLVTRRDQEIDNFISRPFYEVLAHLTSEPATGRHKFVAKWQPSTACEPYMDSDGHVLSKKLAQNVVDRITDKPARVSKVTVKHKTQAPPLPYNLSALQIDAANRFSMSAQQVLDTCQRLYERHKLVTYPRSDNRYLPMEHFPLAGNVVKAIGRNSESLRTFAEEANTGLKSKAWDDKKVSAHHAIIPTEKTGQSGDLSKQLSKQELQIYELIARQFLCQFYVKHEYVETRLEIEIEGGLFVANARESKVEGWKQLFPASKPKTGKDKPGKDKELQTGLPTLKKGDLLHCQRGELLEKQTQPPAHFTDATLLAAMTGIARFVKDLQIKKILKETDGLGTEATRAGIIELLFKRHFLTRKGKQIHATATGRALIQSLPESATLPDMTAQWESVLDAISKNQSNYAVFMQPLKASLHALITQSKSAMPNELKGMKTGKAHFRKRRRKSKSEQSS